MNLPITNTLLPRQVDCIEMSRPIVEALKLLECRGVETYDAFLRTMVCVVAPVICVICDNPRASEVTNNLSPSAKMFCRICMVHSHLMHSDTEITKNDFCQVNRDSNPGSVGEARVKCHTLEQMALIRSQRTATEKAALRTQYGVKDVPNAMLELPLDLHK